MKYIELLNEFKELENEVKHFPIWTPDRKYRFNDLCNTMSNPSECNIITFGDFDCERSEFLSSNEIDNLVYIRNRIAYSCPDTKYLAANGYFLRPIFKSNFYRMVDDSCIDYVTEVCKRKDRISCVSEFCNILVVASDVVFDWVDPNIDLYREGALWDGRDKYMVIDSIYSQKDKVNVYTIHKYNELIGELAWILPLLNVEFMKESKILNTIIDSNKKWINTVADRYLSDPRRRKGDLVQSCAYYDQTYTYLEVIWGKLGYENRFRKR